MARKKKFLKLAIWLCVAGGVLVGAYQLFQRPEEAELLSSSEKIEFTPRSRLVPIIDLRNRGIDYVYPKVQEPPHPLQTKDLAPLSGVLRVAKNIYRMETTWITDDGISHYQAYSGDNSYWGVETVPFVYGTRPRKVEVRQFSAHPDVPSVEMTLLIPASGNLAPRLPAKSLKVGQWELQFQPQIPFAPNFSMPYRISIPNGKDGDLFLVTMTSGDYYEIQSKVRGNKSSSIAIPPKNAVWRIVVTRVSTELAKLSGQVADDLRYMTGKPLMLNPGIGEVAAVHTDWGGIPGLYEARSTSFYGGLSFNLIGPPTQPFTATIHRRLEEASGEVEFQTASPR